jgi:hypothetical protein
MLKINTVGLNARVKELFVVLFISCNIEKIMNHIPEEQWTLLLLNLKKEM